MEHYQELVDQPKLLGDPSAKAARAAQLREPHIAPLTEFVERLRHKTGIGAAIPNYDPCVAGAII